ncbi:MAG: type IV secretion system DotC family protein [Rhodocyclaceae bacterium]|nr:type IV secretion system DotC family protein [Rhodocyclaceae bacterium]
MQAKRWILAALAAGLWAANAQASTQASSRGLDLQSALELRRTEAAGAQERLSPVREVALRDIGQALGARIGFAERSREIIALLDQRAGELDERFDFGRLVISNNVLPPVISESRDAATIEQTTMRVAGIIYRIDEPARFALPTPTWRNWLYLGLDPTPAKAPDLVGSLPSTPQEQAYWQQMVRQGYEMGRQQAQETFDLNMALLKRTHDGMRRYYDLWARGVVSAPVVTSAHSIMRHEDESTIAVGDTLLRITAPATFTKPANWRPLDAALQE